MRPISHPHMQILQSCTDYSDPDGKNYNYLGMYDVVVVIFCLVLRHQARVGHQARVRHIHRLWQDRNRSTRSFKSDSNIKGQSQENGASVC